MGQMTREGRRRQNMDKAERDRKGPRRRATTARISRYKPKDGDEPSDVAACAFAESKRAARRARNLRSMPPFEGRTAALSVAVIETFKHDARGYDALLEQRTARAAALLRAFATKGASAD